MLTMINLNRLQHTAGVSFPVFEFPSRRLPHLEGTWLIHLRSSLAELDASLQIANLKILPTQRENDVYLMDIAVSSNFTDKELRYINYCRFFFKCLTLSDICDAGGKKIANGIYSGVISRFQSVSCLREPYQDNPGTLAWRA